MKTLAAALAGSVLCACGASRASFAPLTAEHPASPRAEEAGIEDPGKSLLAGAPAGDAEPYDGDRHDVHSGHATGAAAGQGHPAGSGQSGGSQGGEAPARAQYVCPMHREVVSETPGRCPKCGMKLEEKPKRKRGSR